MSQIPLLSLLYNTCPLPRRPASKKGKQHNCTNSFFDTPISKCNLLNIDIIRNNSDVSVYNKQLFADTFSALRMYCKFRLLTFAGSSPVFQGFPHKSPTGILLIFHKNSRFFSTHMHNAQIFKI